MSATVYLLSDTLPRLGAKGHGGFPLAIAEATAVAAEGRISDRDAGLWNDEQVEAWKPGTRYVCSHGAAVGVQLAHAGAKASTYGWLEEPEDAGNLGCISDEKGGWVTATASSNEIFDLNPTAAMSTEQIAVSVQDWVAAAQRVAEAGADVIQIHAAHGYLVHQFLSQLSNKRTDACGGSFENRTRYLREVVQAVAKVWPAHKALAIRFSGEDWVEEGWGIADTVKLAQQMYDRGVRAFDLSSAGIGPFAGSSDAGYQVPLAQAVKQALPADAFVTAVGAITDAIQAEHIVVSGQADGVCIGRAALGDPQWSNRAAQALGAEMAAPAQYWRGHW